MFGKLTEIWQTKPKFIVVFLIAAVIIGGLIWQQPDGSSKIIVLAGSTAITKTATGSKTDLATGTKVVVFGSTNEDGSVTAQNIQIDSQFMQKGAPETGN